MTTDITTYLQDGCGRCEYFATDNCKVRKWQNEIKNLRIIILSTGLQESMKWGAPCYTHENKNILLISALKEFVAISFLKGALIQDAENLLVKPGENSQSAMYMKFYHISEVLEKKTILTSYIFEAIEVEKAGLEVNFSAKNQLEYPSELLSVFNNDLVYKEAFEKLTPGRKRSYILHFMQTKQSSTRTARIEKSREKVLSGKGISEY